MTRRRRATLTARLLAPLSLGAVLQAGCGEGGNPPPTAPEVAHLVLDAVGLPEWYTAPFALLHDDQLVLQASVLPAAEFPVTGLPLGTYVVRWGRRVAEVGGYDHSFEAVEDTVALPAAGDSLKVTGQFVQRSGAVEVTASGAPAGSDFGMVVLNGADSVVATARVTMDVPRRISNLLAGSYRLAFYPGAVTLNGRIHPVIPPDTVAVTVVADTAPQAVVVAYRPQYAIIEITVLGLPDSLFACSWYVNLDNSWGVSSCLRPPRGDLVLPSGGTILARWDTVRAGGTTWVPAWDPGPYAVPASFLPTRHDTVTFAPQ